MEIEKQNLEEQLKKANEEIEAEKKKRLAGEVRMVSESLARDKEFQELRALNAKLERQIRELNRRHSVSSLIINIDDQADGTMLDSIRDELDTTKNSLKETQSMLQMTTCDVSQEPIGETQL